MPPSLSEGTGQGRHERSAREHRRNEHGLPAPGFFCFGSSFRRALCLGQSSTETHLTVAKEEAARFPDDESSSGRRRVEWVWVLPRRNTPSPGDPDRRSHRRGCGSACDRAWARQHATSAAQCWRNRSQAPYAKRLERQRKSVNTGRSRAARPRRIQVGSGHTDRPQERCGQ
jgi:hypothetical protein